jgi:hypothetical protein
MDRTQSVATTARYCLGPGSVATDIRCGATNLQRLLLGQGAILALHGTLFFQSIVVSTVAIGLSRFPNTRQDAP